MRIFAVRNTSESVFYKALLGLILGIYGAFMGFPFAMAGDDGVMMLSIAPVSCHSGTAKVVRAKVMINAPPALVWDILTDYPDLKKIFPGYEKSTVMKASGNSKWLDIAMRVAAFLPTYRYQVHVREDEAHYQLELDRISGDFKALNADYQLIPQAGGTRTLLVYRLNIDPGLTPPGSQGVIRNHTEKSLKALERHAELLAKKSLIGHR